MGAQECRVAPVENSPCLLEACALFGMWRDALAQTMQQGPHLFPAMH
jgi:hypothetical protein